VHASTGSAAQEEGGDLHCCTARSTARRIASPLLTSAEKKKEEEKEEAAPAAAAGERSRPSAASSNQSEIMGALKTTQPRPKLDMIPGRKFSTTTSAAAAIRSNRSGAPGLVRSTQIERFPTFCCV